jgi:hypothetical protein
MRNSNVLWVSLLGSHSAGSLDYFTRRVGCPFKEEEYSLLSEFFGELPLGLEKNDGE